MVVLCEFKKKVAYRCASQYGPNRDKMDLFRQKFFFQIKLSNDLPTLRATAALNVFGHK